MIIRRTSVFLIFVAVPTSFCFVPLPDRIKQFLPSPLEANNFLDTVKGEFNKALEQPPKVSIPDGFQIPEPKPLSVTRSSELPSLLKSSVALGLRLGTGAFTLGWKIESLFAAEEDGKYALELGPIRLRDSSTVLQDAPRPKKPLIIYEYEASPFCRRVREMVNLLDLTVEYRPCPGARAGFSDELFARTGRRTVPYMIDPNNGVEMFESDDQIEYMLNTYGPSDTKFDRKALWPITFSTFSVITSGLAAVVRDFAGSKTDENKRPDNEKMKPVQLWG